MRNRHINDLRTQRTLVAIDKAFCKLLLENTYEKLTVTKICTEACIGRKAFYTYYASLENLFSKKLQDFSQEYINRIKKYTVPEELEKINREFYLYSLDQGELYERIVVCPAYNSIGDKLLTDLTRKTWQNSIWFQNLAFYQQNILLSFIYHTGSGLYRRWIIDGKVVPLEEIITLSGQILTKGIESFNNVFQKYTSPRTLCHLPEAHYRKPQGT